ncbi:MAG: GNAT family N-acetyltransferase [Dermatophilaceae bacterium]
MNGVGHRTARLLLRQWRAADREPFAALNADAEVMRHFPSTLDRAASDALVDREQAAIDERGWGLWALERVADGAFLGVTGLAVPRHPLPCQPCVEVGWRLTRHAWGNGYATEAAGEALRVAFAELRLDEVVSFTSVGNVRSRAVMGRLDMTRDPDGDFDHPALPAGHPLQRHVLYRRRPVG